MDVVVVVVGGEEAAGNKCGQYAGGGVGPAVVRGQSNVCAGLNRGSRRKGERPVDVGDGTGIVPALWVPVVLRIGSGGDHVPVYGCPPDTGIALGCSEVGDFAV